MKKTKHETVDVCDVCLKNETHSNCIKCGKAICYDCQDKHAVDYHHAIHFSGSGDGLYCKKCDAELRSKPTKLWLAYRKIADLRFELEVFQKDFRNRQIKAETHLKELQGKL